MIRLHTRAITIFLLLALTYLGLRCWNLTYLPYFGDEAEYMWYAYSAIHDPHLRFVSLEVGKQPLFIWITMFYIKVLGDPLVAGRMVSVSAGFLTVIGIWLLTRQLLKNNTIALLAVLLFISNPLASLINRIGNFDSTVGMFYLWSLYLTVLLVQTVRLDVAYTLGFSL